MVEGTPSHAKSVKEADLELVAEKVAEKAGEITAEDLASKEIIEMTIINTAQQDAVRDIVKVMPSISRDLFKTPTQVPVQVQTEYRASYNKEYAIEVLIDGVADGPSGFAVHLRDWARHLAKYGVHVFIPETRPTEYPEIHKMKVNPDSNGFKPIELLIYSGGGFHPKNPNRAVIGYTVFESDRFPVNLKNDARNVDYLWTASDFCYDRLIQTGIPREKVEMFPEGVDTEIFSPYATPSLKKKVKFLFGIIVGWSERKGINTLLNAFLKEFDRNEDVGLYCSGGWYAERVAQKEVEEAKKKIGKYNYPEIILDWNNRLDWQMSSLYTSLDCYVLPTKGEGYNRTVAEAMSCAIPTISTDFPPTNEILNTSNGYPIKVEKIAPEPRADWICDYYKGADFAHPSEEHLRSLMRSVFEDYDTAKGKAEKGREDIKKNHNVTLIIEDVVKRLAQIKEEFY